MATIRRERTSRELMLASERMLYEAQRLRRAASAVGRLALSGDDQGGVRTIRDALNEAIVLHGGMLMRFLYTDNPDPDEVIAEDFFDDPTTWRELRLTKSSRLAALEWMGRELTRLGCGWPEWPSQTTRYNMSTMGSDVEEALADFVWKVPEGKVTEELWEFLKAPERLGGNGNGP